MTLNDNPLVSAEKRRKQLYKRLDWLVKYRAGRFAIDYNETGMAARLYIDPNVKVGKADRLISAVQKELHQVKVFMNHFK